MTSAVGELFTYIVLFLKLFKSGKIFKLFSLYFIIHCFVLIQTQTDKNVKNISNS